MPATEHPIIAEILEEIDAINTILDERSETFEEIADRLDRIPPRLDMPVAGLTEDERMDRIEAGIAYTTAMLKLLVLRLGEATERLEEIPPE